jgi:uracil-DNA glycosylase
MPVDLFGHPAASWRGPLAAQLDAVPADWRAGVQAWRASPAGRSLSAFVEARQRSGAVIYPPEPLRALQLTSLAQVRVVILGQDPYHGPGQAEGLAFSVPRGLRVPPSLRNVFAELQRDLGVPMPTSGHLGGWARQGVLLLNTCLTVEQGLPASHAKQGWEALTDALIEAVAQRGGAPLAFLLWGNPAQAKAPLIERAGQGRHLLLRANHPSPLSARRPPVPFMGCGHFSAVRDAGIDVAWADSSA